MPEEYSSDAFVSFVDYNGSTTLCPKLEIEYQIKQNTISTSFLLNGGLARFTGGMR